MAAVTGPNLGLSSGWVPGEGGWGPLMNDNMRLLDATAHLSVLSATATTPAVSTDGTRYIVPAAGATGDFAGQAGKLAVRVAGAWVFYTPKAGWTAFVSADGSELRWSGTAWVDALAAQVQLDMSNTGSWTLPNGTTWTLIPLYTKNVDTANGWNATTYKFTPPISGLYMVEAMVRPLRSGTGALGSGITFCLGFGTNPADSIDVVTGNGADLNELAIIFCKPMRLLAGTAYHIFGKHYAPAAVSFTFAQLKIVRVGA